MKGVGMLVVSFRGVNFGFWSHLGCLSKTPSHLAVKVLLKVAREKYKNVCIVCVLTWSLSGVKKAWATPRSVSFTGLIQNFRRASLPLSYVESPPELLPHNEFKVSVR